MRDGFRWSPDGRRVAYWQFDTTGVGIFTLLNNTDTLYPVATRIPYPKPGTATPRCASAWSSAEGGETTLDGRRRAIRATATWPGSNGATPRTLAIQQLNRLQNQQDLLHRRRRASGRRLAHLPRSLRDLGRRGRLGALGGQGPRVPVDQRARRLAPHLPRGRRRQRHRAGDALRRRRHRRSPASMRPSEWLYFIASPDERDARATCIARGSMARARPSASRPPTSPARTATAWRPGGRLAFHTYSRFDVPPVTDVVELPGHRVLRTLTDTDRAARGAGAGADAAGGVLHGRHRRRRVARRLDAEAVARSTRRSKYPLHHLRLRRAGRRRP